ncbi:hypothetical protein DYB32_003323 [Aphanomyces invadans]|uniref:Uncharacterized protein n=1 Tax=Aphanomyces invadans TaxID=157072 RepID=A0A418B110_9STRA|nr:hypothetical protein DYB32_003323 [Aphanomyces invadans]
MLPTTAAFARRSSAPSVLSGRAAKSEEVRNAIDVASSVDDENDPQPHEDTGDIQEKNQQESFCTAKKLEIKADNNQEENEAPPVDSSWTNDVCGTPVTLDEVKVALVDAQLDHEDVQVTLDEGLQDAAQFLADHPLPVDTTRAIAAAWIVPFGLSSRTSHNQQPATEWPQALADIAPKHFQAFSRRYDGHDKVPSAGRAAADVVKARQTKARYHNQLVELVALRRQDAKVARVKGQRAFWDVKQEDASTRRDNYLLARRLPTRSVIQSNETFDGDDFGTLGELSRQRVAAASVARGEFLTKRQLRAGAQADRAKAISADAAAMLGHYEVVAMHDLEARLARAEVRRTIHLDKRRLIAGRHSNYVKSVYLTNRYMERREAERLDMAMDAAIARRDAHLESVQSRARSIIPPIRTTGCAFRLFDAQWLNQALRSAAAQQAAALRRDAILQERGARLQEAALRRQQVARTRLRVSIETASAVSHQLASRLHEASRRRSANVAWVRHCIAGRRDHIRARKIQAAHIAKRRAKEAALDKVNQATKRRESWIERRRAAAAARNWYAKVLAHRQQEALQEAAEALAARIQDNQAAAAQKRAEFERPLFSELVALRALRVKHVLHSNQQLLARLSARKAALAAVRLTEFAHQRARTSHATWLHTQQVTERREHDQVFRQQCVASRAFARLRSAEIRRALAFDAIRVAAEEERARGDAARLRVHIHQEELRAFSTFRLIRADEKRALRQADKVSAAIWFRTQGQLARTRNLLREETLRTSSAQAVQEASLRKSIGLTLRARKYFVERAVVATRQNCMRLVLAEKEAKAAAKLESAAARRQDLLEAKQKTARRTLDRVVLTRLERQSTEVVDNAIRTAMQATINLHAESRRYQVLQERQRRARSRSQRATTIARTLKTTRRLAAQSKREAVDERVEESTKRRDALLAARKRGHSTVKKLQPYAGLQVVGTAMTLWPQSAA